MKGRVARIVGKEADKILDLGQCNCCAGKVVFINLAMRPNDAKLYIP
jgi:predicted nucleic acid-binding Zn finger protein